MTADDAVFGKGAMNFIHFSLCSITYSFKMLLYNSTGKCLQGGFLLSSVDSAAPRLKEYVLQFFSLLEAKSHEKYWPTLVISISCDESIYLAAFLRNPLLVKTFSGFKD